ncbi:rhodanese-like domain-containing protein [Candidatus Latescibacterota bacterium]
MNYVDLNTEESYDIIQKNKGNRDFVILDVRTPEEYNTVHIEYAINKNYNSSEFKEMLATLDTDKTYIVYCRSGGRSSNALKVMKEMGFKNVYHMLGGITGWLNAKYPTVGY